jgi:glycosyltransferase involved in cell wall biosynthesis
MLKHSAYVAIRQASRGAFPVLLRAEGGGETGDVFWQRHARFGRRICRQCQQGTVVAPSQQIVDELLQAGYDRGRVHYVPNGVAVSPRIGDRNAARLALADANRDLLALDDAPVAAFTGRLSRKKGLFELVRAWAAVVQAKPNAKLWLVGEGDDRETLFQMVKDLDLQGRVLMPGAFDDVGEVLQAADLFVLPSHEEGMSLSLLEAMAAGCPVVASDIPGNRTLVEHDVHGQLTPVGDVAALAGAILRTIDATDRRRWGEAGRTLVRQRYSLQQCAARHLQLIEAMVRAGGGSAPEGLL